MLVVSLPNTNLKRSQQHYRMQKKSFFFHSISRDYDALVTTHTERLTIQDQKIKICSFELFRGSD